MQGRVFVQIVFFNSFTRHGEGVSRCFEALRELEGYTLGENLFVTVIDNASGEHDQRFLESNRPPEFSLIRNPANLGFCGANNQGVEIFLESEADYLLLLNPDLALEKNCLINMVRTAEEQERAGLITPKLLRANENLKPLSPAVIDAAGMFFNNSLRHLDRGSGEMDTGQYEESGYVGGGTGACLFLKKDCVKDLLLESPGEEGGLYQVYPELKTDSDKRSQLFDEAFFAYREDAELSLRAWYRNWKCLYEPKAIGYHKRAVLPENRNEIEPELNRLSVRNRFLLQLTTFPIWISAAAFVKGSILRNLLVLLGILFIERSSIPALKDVSILFKRCIVRRKVIISSASLTRQEVSRLFSDKPFFRSL